MANQKKTNAPFSSGNRKRKKWTTIVIYLMIIAMLLSVFTMGAGMFI
ncbi:stressosome-associated protein Prli42 [Halalkalibacillus sediminis]|nr:stressosome-associated protein Prli42 [Halalkalibacillus sediminis]